MLNLCVCWAVMTTTDAELNEHLNLLLLLLWVFPILECASNFRSSWHENKILIKFPLGVGENTAATKFYLFTVELLDFNGFSSISRLRVVGSVYLRAQWRGSACRLITDAEGSSNKIRQPETGPNLVQCCHVTELHFLCDSLFAGQRRT